MSQKTEVLNKVDVFKFLDYSAKKSLETVLEKRVVFEGEEIAKEGEQALFFFILISGRMMLSTKEEKAVVLKESGDFVGFELISSKGIYNATIKSLVDGEILLLERSRFLEMIKEDSLMAEKITSEWEAYLSKRAPFVEKLDYFGAEPIY